MNNSDIKKLSVFRKTLHRYPELSGEEKETAKRVLEFFEPLKPDMVFKGLGGNGLAFIFEGKEEGPVSLFRCELDALPIKEENDIKHLSKIPSKSHVCGHDGHMAIISGLGMELSQNRPQKGKIILLFQPAEETGEGAEAIIRDPKFKEIQPDYAFALHNLPGFESHQIVIKKGAFAAASIGMIILFKGRNSHSAHPEAGNSPAEAMAKTIVALEKLPDAMKKFTLVTVIHAKLGEVAFGTTPGEATVMATLRAHENETRDLLVLYAEKLCTQISKEYGLEVAFEYTEVFAATHNDPEAWELGNQAAKNLDLKTKHIRIPFRWSEDFGLFSSYTKTLLFGLGSGKNQPQLHEPNFDFPDELIPTGVKMFKEIMQQLHY
ncbi:amidohydrolase [Cecembia lonarensis]|uniref:Putative hydrolase YxeP n=1 Tax=Cecembia lonarensis (strain CCUG 58316 / KCTC 22772 / LW9) TaxID=1225176 RepID=K1L0B3_CECL9|nr:amidohydrolase [Cecembia lonarensis]EKB49770.1 putative hydrolase YxeP [Cecembia lonarensis LW9]